MYAQERHRQLMQKGNTSSLTRGAVGEFLVNFITEVDELVRVEEEI